MQFVTQVKWYINTNICGDVRCPGQWKFPLTKDKKLVEKATMSNGEMLDFIDELDGLIEELLDETNPHQTNPHQNKWLDAMASYRAVMLKARSRTELSDNNIDIFQDLADMFDEKWISLHSMKGVTNYFHVIGSGHLSYHLKAYGNLCHCSQQGWEALNQKIKFVFFHNMQRDGQKKG